MAFGLVLQRRADNRDGRIGLGGVGCRGNELDLHARSGHGTKPGQRRDRGFRAAAVAAGDEHVRMRADDGDRLDLRSSSGRNGRGWPAGRWIPGPSCATARDVPGSQITFGRNPAVGDQLRRVELAQAEADAQHADARHRPAAPAEACPADRGGDVVHELLVGEVAAGDDRLGDGIRQVHFALFMALDHGSHAAKVRNDEALEAPLLLENVGEQERVHVIGRAVDGVVGGHDRVRPGPRPRRRGNAAASIRAASAR